MRFAGAFFAAISMSALACSSAAQTVSTPTPRAYVALADCPVTVPASPLVPPAPYLTEPPAYYKSAWHGRPELWTMLNVDGERWAGLPQNADGSPQKTWWWSRNFDINTERQPAITVTGERLDADGSFTAGSPGTHAWADFGTAMLVGIEVPTTGCWEIRAEYKGAELAYVVLVE